MLFSTGSNFHLSWKDREKSAVLDLVQDFHGDSAGDEHAAERQNFQRQIARFRAIDRAPQIQSFHADRA